MFKYETFSHNYPHSVAEVENNTVSFENDRIASRIDAIRQSCEGNETLERLYEEMLDYCFSYAETVFRYNELFMGDITDPRTNEALKDLEDERRRVHDATIDSINILARTLKKEGRDGSWIASLKDSRALYGHFALAVTCAFILKEKEENSSDNK
jgi:hypothetical protein